MLYLQMLDEILCIIIGEMLISSLSVCNDEVDPFSRKKLNFKFKRWYCYDERLQATESFHKS